MRRASLPWYDLPELQAATDALWAGIARHLRAEGFSDVPDVLTRRPGEELWSDPELLFSQTCGFPLTHAFAGKLRVVAIPCYEALGCGPGSYRSFVVVGQSSRAKSIGDLAGNVCAINDSMSHSGMNALRALIAPVARGKPFFERVITTGSHLASLEAVGRGDADVAAIDCVTHALAQAARPAVLAGTRVLMASAEAPAPPFVTRNETTDEELAALRHALRSAFGDPDLAPTRVALRLGDVVIPDDDVRAYAPILAMERAAAEQDYALLA